MLQESGCRWCLATDHRISSGVAFVELPLAHDSVILGQPSTRTDYQASEDDTWLAKRIADDPLSLGYFGLAYSQLEAHDSKTLAIDDGDFRNGVGAVLPTPATITSGEYGALSRLLFLYINSKSLGRREVELFANFVLNKAERLVPRAGYVPLSHEGYQFVLRQLAEKVTGSMFDKPEVYRTFERNSRQPGVAAHQ